MDWLRMYHVVEELAPKVNGGQLQKVRQPDPATVCLSIRSPGVTTHLILSARPECARITAAADTGRTLDTPTGLGMWIRKHGKGRRVGELSLSSKDRVITLPVFGGRLVLEIFGRTGLICAIDESGILRAATGRLRSQLTMGAPYVAPVPPQNLRQTSDEAYPGALALEALYSTLVNAREDKQTHQVIHRLFKGAEKKLRRLRMKIQGDIDRCEDADEHRIHGELLKGQLHRVTPGASHVLVDDWFAEGTPQRTIPLDPKLDGPGNIEALFRKYKRGRDGLHKAQSRLELVEKKATLLNELKSSELTVDALKAQLHTLKLWSPQRVGDKRTSTPRLPYFLFHSQSGEPIWVGRGGADNHATTFRHARGNDRWLHTKDVPGAHVIVPCRQRGKAPHPDTLLDAASLAIHHSRLRNEENVAVSHTERKHVRAVKGGPPGLVTIAAAKTLIPHDVPRRIERLYRDRPT